MDGGPFFLWDGCQACATLPRIDLSLRGYVAATGDDTCARGTVGGFDVYVMDNHVIRSGARIRAEWSAGVLVAAMALASSLV